MYTFTPLERRPPGFVAGKVDVPSLTIEKILEGNGRYLARFRGSLLALFGAPLSSSQDTNPAFIYIIKAQDEAGNQWTITAYEGPSGPAFGSNVQSTEAIQAAEALLQLIEQTPPANFTATYTAGDTNTTVTYGCVNSDCYWREDETGGHEA